MPLIQPPDGIRPWLTDPEAALQLPRLTADEALCTHGRRDYNARERVRLQKTKSQTIAFSEQSRTG